LYCQNRTLITLFNELHDNNRMGKIVKSNWFRKIFEKIYTDKVRLNILQALPFWIGALITGLIAVLYAKLFSLAETFSLSVFHSASWLLFIITPFCFVSAWWIVKRFDENAAGSGIPQVMAAIELANPRYNYLVDKLLSVKAVFVKILSTLLMITGGAAIGREGPTVQIAASIFRKVNQLLPASWPKVSKKNMIMTGAAAGLAAAFNTPLGGIVFAVEELAKTHISYFKTALFTAVIIAGLTAQGILGPYLYLGYPEVSNTSGYLVFFVIIVSCVSGLGGSLMSVAILRLLAWKRRIKLKQAQLLYVLACAFAVAFIACFFTSGILGSGKSEMSGLLFSANKHAEWYMPFVRIFGCITAFTSGAAGGVFAPSLGIGATIGALVAELFHFTAANANILILSGMVAFLTGVTRSPFTSAILVLEMTDRHSVVFYLMLAGLAAGLIANLIDRHSFYDHLKVIYLNKAYQDESVKNKPPEEFTE